MPILYLDASALVKLVIGEAETAALLSHLKDHPDRISSAISILELHRALHRADAVAADHRRGDEVLARVALMRIDDAILKEAAELAISDLRSLDAIHLATALSVEKDLSGFVSYDRRLSAAARNLKLPVESPR